MTGGRIIGRDKELSYLEDLWNRKGLVTCCITLAFRAKKAGFTENVTFMLFSASGFEEELSEYAEENGIVLVDGRILNGEGKSSELFE